MRSNHSQGRGTHRIPIILPQKGEISSCAVSEPLCQDKRDAAVFPLSASISYSIKQIQSSLVKIPYLSLFSVDTFHSAVSNKPMKGVFFLPPLFPLPYHFCTLQNSPFLSPLSNNFSKMFCGSSDLNNSCSYKLKAIFSGV